MIINGRQIAQEIQEELMREIGKSDTRLSLHIFVVGENPVIESFVKYKKIFANKIGVEFVEHRFNNDITEDELIGSIKAVSDEADGIVIQLPLPESMDTKSILDSVPSKLDVDGLASDSEYLTPVAGAIKEMLEYEHIEIKDKVALVIGKGRLVGEPVAKFLAESGAIVISADKSTDKDELTSISRKSDIIVSGAGVPNLVTKDMVKDGSILLDAGTSTSGGSVVGDIALDCEYVARHFSRTPGGIGPLTVALLFKNLVNGSLMTK